MTEKLGRHSSRRDNRKGNLSEISPTKSSTSKNELKIGESDYFSDAVDLSRFQKAVENRTKSQVEEERELVKKATRANEKLLAKINECSSKSALKEAEYTLKDRDFDEKEMRLTAEVEKKEKEISRTKEELRAEADRLRTRISSRDSGYDSREEKKVESHNAVCAGLKEKIEKARAYMMDNDEMARVDERVKQLQEHIKNEELEIRKKQEQLAERQEELRTEKENVSHIKEKLKELEEGSVDLASVSREKKLLERDFDNLEKELKELQAAKEVKENDDDIWSLKGQLKQAKNDADDLNSKRDRLETQIQRVKSGLTVEIGAASNLVANIRKEKTYESKSTTPVVSTYVSPYGKTYGGTSVGNSRTNKKTEVTREQTQKLADLKKQKREYESRTGPKAEPITNLEKAIRDQESLKSKAEQLLKSTEESQIGIEKLLAQQKQVFAAEIETSNQKIDLLSEISQKNNAQLQRIAKEMKDTLFEIGELQEQIKQTTTLLNDAKSNLRTTEATNKKKESSNQRADRENQANLKTYRDIVDKLNETEDKKANARQIIEETQLDFNETKRDFSSEIHTLEREIYDQTEKTEFLQQVIGELTKELDDLKWYFKPHKQKQEKENRVYGTTEFDLITEKRKNTDSEIKTLQTNLETIAMDHEWKRHMFASDEGLSGYFKASKKALEVYKNRSDVNQENVDDMVAHVQILIRQLEKHYDADVALQAAILMINHNVYPGLQLYLANLVEKDHNTHILHRVPMFLRITYRDWRYDCIAKGAQNSDSFRKTLLQACIELRVKQQLADFSHVNKFVAQVLGGEEMSRDEVETWLRDAAEFFIFFNKEGTRDQIEAMVAGEEIPGIDDV